MKNGLWLSLTLAVVLGFAADETFARGGGGGRGGARGGSAGRSFSGPSRSAGEGREADGGDRNGGERNVGQRSGNVQNRASQARTNAGSRAAAFSPGWYGNHPGAGRYGRPWGAAGFGAAAAWLGMTDGATVYTSDTTGDDGSDDDSASDDDQASDESTTTNDDQFLSLGVFSLGPQNEKDPTAMVQLAIAKDGTVRGSYYDVLTDQDQNVQGLVDKKTQRVSWTVGANGPVQFETQLSQLTQDKGQVTLRFGNGQTKTWALSRYQDAAAAAK